MKFFVTGAAGFIGSTFVDRVLADGHAVVGYDNFSTGQESFVEVASGNPMYLLVRADTLDTQTLTAAMEGADIVAHFQANADVRFGTEHPERDLQQNTISTFRVLEAMRANGVGRIVFSSTGSVYGENQPTPTPETAAFPVQTSLYGASKVGGEGLISAYVEGFGIAASVFRFVSILGPRYTHGHVFDFYRQLRSNPKKLHILGNGQQRKSYLHVDDCIEAILTVLRREPLGYSVYNLGVDGYCQVTDSVGWICDELGVKPDLTFGGGERGWIGDSPFIFLDTNKIRGTGWAPNHTIEGSVRMTLRWLRDNPSVLDARA